MPVVGIDDAQARFGCGGQVNGVSAPQKDGCRQPLVDISNSCHNFLILREPLESSHLDMSPYLGQQGGISRCSDRSFAQLAMEGRYHFGLPVRRSDNMACRFVKFTNSDLFHVTHCVTFRSRWVKRCCRSQDCARTSSPREQSDYARSVRASGNGGKARSTAEGCGVGIKERKGSGLTGP